MDLLHQGDCLFQRHDDLAVEGHIVIGEGAGNLANVSNLRKVVVGPTCRVAPTRGQAELRVAQHLRCTCLTSRRF